MVGLAEVLYDFSCKNVTVRMSFISAGTRASDTAQVEDNEPERFLGMFI